VITGAGGRRRWTVDDKVRIVEETREFVTLATKPWLRSKLQLISQKTRLAAAIR
jgi:hypothetical protein